MSYFAQKALSNSALSYINPDQEGSPQKFKRFLDGTLADESSPSLEKGDLIHKMMLEPDAFEVLSINKPSEVVCGIVEDVLSSVRLDNTPGARFDAYRDVIGDAVVARDYQRTWKIQTRVDKVIELGEEYFNHLLRDDKRIVIDHATFSCAQECIASLNRDPTANKLLNQQTDDKYVVYNELAIYWRLMIDGEEVACKSKIDKLLVNQKTKRFNIIDLKTTSKHVCRYPESFQFWHTYRQLAFYEAAVSWWMENANGQVDYLPGNHYIASVMTKDPYLTRVYKVDRSWIEKGKREYESLVQRVQYHTQTGNWVFEQEHESHGGVFTLEIPALFNLADLVASV